MPEPKENLDHQLVNARGAMIAQFDRLIEQADGIEQELVYAEVNRDEANARVEVLLSHIGQLRERIRQWGEGHVSDSDLTDALFAWARTDLDTKMQEAANADK